MQLKKYSLNQIIKDELDIAEKKKKERTKTILEWAKDNYIIKNKRYSLEKREYLTEILSNDFKHIVIKKSAQCGVSELAIINSIYFGTS